MADDGGPTRGIGGAISDTLYNAWLHFRVGAGTTESKGTCNYCTEEEAEPVTLSRDELPPKAEGAIRVVVVSDTHGQHAEIGELPAGDIFIHCGDILMSARLWTDAGQVEKLKSFNEWLGSLPFASRVVIAGNHDMVVPRLGVEATRSLLANASYLENDAVEVAGGLTVFGTPCSRGKSGNSAFQDDAFHSQAQEAAAALIEGVDILVTHGPCQSAVSSRQSGQLEPWLRHLKPRLHCWGHAHALYGVRECVGDSEGSMVSVCASTMTTGYNPRNPPVVIDLATRDATQSDNMPDAAVNATDVTCAQPALC